MTTTLVQGLYVPEDVNDVRECELCGERIYRYCHSQAGPLRAFAWTTIGPDSEDDPRYGTRCQYAETFAAWQHDLNDPDDIVDYWEGE